MHGNVILLTSAKLTSGKIINMIDNKDLTSGKLLHVKSSSSHASNPLHMELPNIETGNGVRLDIGKHLRSGIGMLLDSKDGNQMDTGGTLLFVNGIKQKQGTLLHIAASNLNHGSAVTLDTLSSMSTGTLLNATTTTSTGNVDGAVRLTANEMKSGTAMKINTNMLTNGTALHVTSNDGEMLQSNGTLVYIDGRYAESNFIVIESASTTVEVKGRTTMTDGTLTTTTTMAPNTTYTTTMAPTETSSLTTGKVP